MSTRPRPLAERSVDDADGLRTGVTITHRDGRLWLWLAEEDEMGDIHDTPLGDRPATGAGLFQVVHMANMAAVGGRIPTPLAHAVILRPFTEHECIVADPALAAYLVGNTTTHPARSLVEELFG